MMFNLPQTITIFLIGVLVGVVIMTVIFIRLMRYKGEENG